jgi:hypothetical protein
MKTVVVKAVNLQPSDVLNGQRIKAVHKYARRTRAKVQGKLDTTGVLVIAPNPDGYKLDTFEFVGGDFVTVKRPKYNMRKNRAYV